MMSVGIFYWVNDVWLFLKPRRLILPRQMSPEPPQKIHMYLSLSMVQLKLEAGMPAGWR